MTLIYKIASLLGAFLVIAALFIFGSTMAKADGYEGGGGYKDGGYAYSHTPKRARLDPPHRLRAYLSPEELRTLKRIKAKAEMRMAGYRTEKVSKNYRKRNYEADAYAYASDRRRIRYAESRYTRSDVEVVRGGDRECRAPIAIVGEERGWRGRALGNAKDLWRSNAIGRHGYAYGDIEAARNVIPNCKIIRTNKWGKDIWVCSLSARPCREM
jgi:hypothetical protein